MASNPNNPDWEEERSTHHSFLNRLGLLDIPDFVYPLKDISHQVADFPLPSFRCRWSWCPLCLPTPTNTERNVNHSVTAPTAPVPVTSTKMPPQKSSMVKEARTTRQSKCRRQWRAAWRSKLAKGLDATTTFGLENLSLHDEKRTPSRKQVLTEIRRQKLAPAGEKMEKGTELHLHSVGHASFRERSSTLVRQ